jgi:predicted GNAT family acetyltransferase
MGHIMPCAVMLWDDWRDAGAAAQMSKPPPEVRDVPEDGRFVIRADGRRAGFTEYQRQAGAYAFTHTEIDPEFEGKGLGGTLIKAALAQARAEGAPVLPFCPFVRDYIERHPVELDLVPAERRAEFELPA